MQATYIMYSNQLSNDILFSVTPYIVHNLNYNNLVWTYTKFIDIVTVESTYIKKYICMFLFY